MWSSGLRAAHLHLEIVRFMEIVQELGRWGDTCHQQVVARPGAGDVEEVPLGRVDLLQVGVIPDRLDALLQGDDLVILRRSVPRRLDTS